MKRINAIAAGILMVTIPLSAARFSTNATDAHLHTLKRAMMESPVNAAASSFTQGNVTYTVLQPGFVEATKVTPAAGDTEVSIPTSVTNAGTSYYVASIGVQCFSQDSTLTKVTLPETLMIIQPLAFQECKQLATVNIPSNLQFLGAGAFWDCHSLQEANIPAGVTKLQPYTFMECHSLAKVTYTENTDSIGEFCFARCHKLTDVTVKPTVKDIGAGVFREC